MKSESPMAKMKIGVFFPGHSWKILGFGLLRYMDSAFVIRPFISH